MRPLRLAQESAVDALTGVRELVEGSDLCIGVWSCKSISALNAKGKLNRSCCADIEGSTGITFEGIRQYVARHRPWLGLFENVMAVAAAGLCNGTAGRQSGRPALGSDDRPVASLEIVGPCECTIVGVCACVCAAGRRESLESAESMEPVPASNLSYVVAARVGHCATASALGGRRVTQHQLARRTTACATDARWTCSRVWATGSTPRT